MSEGTREMICRLNQHSASFTATAANLQRTARLDISKEQVRQLVEAEGRAVLDQMRHGELTPDWKAADCVIEQETDANSHEKHAVKSDAKSDAKSQKMTAPPKGQKKP